MTDDKIQLYRQGTAFWLDREWKTPRQREVEASNQSLQEENARLKAEVKALKEEVEPLRVFKNIPCSRCGRPMVSWRRWQVLEAFKGWQHTNCE